MSPTKRIAILGAGPSGLAAIKCCKEEGFSAVCYEKSGEPGGLWRYREMDIRGTASVMRSTVMNASKEMSAFSDFPPPTEFPNFMHNSQACEYLMSYAEKFDLLRHIRYNFEVLKVEPTKHFDETGRWSVKVINTKTEAISKEEFDGVLVCVGHHAFPKIPTFPNQDTFKGSIIHTHSLKNCDSFAEQKVVVVGIGNSGLDAAVDCTCVAKQVYLSTRRGGAWIFQKAGANGRPRDIDRISRKHFYRKYLPYNKICNIIEKEANATFDYAAHNIKPNHRALSSLPTMNDSLQECIRSGSIIIKRNIERFEENGIVFEGDEQVTKADAVILATGYDIKFPFIDNQITAIKDNKICLYKHAFPPHLRHPTMAFIGLVHLWGPFFNLSEMQSRLFMQVFSGKVILPSVEDMERDIKRKYEANAGRYIVSTRRAIHVEWISFMDELADMIGVKPNLFKLAITDPKLFFACVFGPCLSYQYRIQGPHSWTEARDAILTCEQRVCAPLNPNIVHTSRINRNIFNRKLISFILVVISAAGYLMYGV